MIEAQGKIEKTVKRLTSHITPPINTIDEELDSEKIHTTDNQLDLNLTNVNSCIKQ